MIDPNIHHRNSKINQKIYATTKTHYSILNYDKKYICFNDAESGMYRSVICSYPEKQVLCFSPAKSISYYIFEKTNGTVISEIVEGIMINLFYDNRIKSWELATKSAVGCKYGQKYNCSELTFYDMFIQALAGNPDKTLNDNPIISLLPKWCSYSFVMNVTSEPRLTLVAVYNIQHLNVLLLPSSIYKNWKVFEGAHNIISFPKECSRLDETNIENGYMLINYETGHRAKWYHPEYIMEKKCNKIKPTIQYQYLCFRRINKVYEYLSYFPKQRRTFHLIKEQYDEYINKTHHYYIEYFVKKEIDWTDIPLKYRDFVYKIHYGIYVQGLSNGMRIVITKNIVKDFFQKKEPMEQIGMLSTAYLSSFSRA